MRILYWLPALVRFILDDLRQFGVDAIRAALREQLRAEDANQFMEI